MGDFRVASASGRRPGLLRDPRASSLSFLFARFHEEILRVLFSPRQPQSTAGSRSPEKRFDTEAGDEECTSISLFARIAILPFRVSFCSRDWRREQRIVVVTMFMESSYSGLEERESLISSLSFVRRELIKTRLL